MDQSPQRHEIYALRPMPKLRRKAAGFPSIGGLQQTDPRCGDNRKPKKKKKNLNCFSALEGGKPPRLKELVIRQKPIWACDAGRRRTSPIGLKSGPRSTPATLGVFTEEGSRCRRFWRLCLGSGTLGVSSEA